MLPIPEPWCAAVCNGNHYLCCLISLSLLCSASDATRLCTFTLVSSQWQPRILLQRFSYTLLESHGPPSMSSEPLVIGQTTSENKGGGTSTHHHHHMRSMLCEKQTRNLIIFTNKVTACDMACADREGDPVLVAKCLCSIRTIQRIARRNVGWISAQLLRHANSGLHWRDGRRREKRKGVNHRFVCGSGKGIERV
jgi:hypothetical protein